MLLELQVVCIILVFGGLSSTLLITTNILRYFYVVRRCRDNSTDSHENISYIEILEKVEVSFSVSGFLLEIFLYILFAVNIVYKGKLKPIGEFFSTKKKSVLNGSYICLITSISFVEFSLSVGRDFKLCEQYPTLSLGVFHVFHAFVKLPSHLSMFFLSFYTVNIFYSSCCLWNEGIKIMTKTKVSLYHDNNIIRRPGQDKLYKLYYDYVEVGNRVLCECYPLKELFLLMYLVCLTFMILDIVDLMTEVIKDDKTKPDGVYKSAAVINGAIFTFVVIVPYIMALILNYIHQYYHMKLTDSYLGIGIELNNTIHKYEPSYALSDPQGVQLQLKDCPVSETDSLIDCKKILQEKYFKEIHRNSLFFAKICKFDFAPSFFIISIPLDSLLYKLSIVGSVIIFFSKLLYYVNDIEVGY